MSEKHDNDIHELIERARIAEEEARREMVGIRFAIHQEKHEASRAIDSLYADKVSAARANIEAAVQAHRNAREGLPDHPWVGRRVYQMQETRMSVWEPSKRVRVEGVVETVRSGTPFAENLTDYKTPKIGDHIVRLLKKDGKLGIKFAGMTQRSVWLLVDGDQDKKDN